MTDMSTALYELEEEVGALDFGEGEPCDFVLFNCDVDEDDERIDRVLLLDTATWMNLGMPQQLEVSLRPA
jgi:hypothetical protein